MLNKTQPTHEINKNFWLSSKSLSLFLVCLLFTYILSYIFRPISYDEAFFAERAYWFSKLGFVKSILFDDYLDWGVHVFAYHKLHIWQGALIIDIFGINIHYLKLIPIAYMCVFIITSYKYWSFLKTSKNEYLFFLFLILVQTYVIQFSMEFRPEIMIMATGFISFYLLRKNIEEKLTTLTFAGIMAGAAALFHLNGLIFIGAGFVLLVSEKKYKSSIIFTIAAIAIFSFYFIEMLTVERFKIFINQFSDAAPTETGGALHWISKIVLSPKRFFDHGYVGLYTILSLTVLWLGRQKISQSKELKAILLYLISLEIFLAIINPGSRSHYLVLHAPYVLILVATCYKTAYERSKKKYILPSLLLLYVFSQLSHVHSISSTHIQGSSFHENLLRKYEVKKNSKIIAPAQFVFNELTNVRIHSIHTYYLNKFLNFEDVLENLYNKNMKFIFLYEGDIKALGAENKTFIQNKKYHKYLFLGKDENIYVFKRTGK